jgi:arabinose-5-phosphate isomerase
LDLAPTSSTTTALVMGDALAIALLEQRGFTAEDFAFSHPGGTLGKKLLLKVQDVMQTGDSVPSVDAATPLSQALLEISNKGLGMTTVTNADGRLAGIFTDGDLRRTLDQQIDINNTPIASLMSTGTKTANPQMLAAEALRIMEEHEITSLVVLDDSGETRGIIHLMHLLHAGIA